jgi:hypothetical protein
MKTLLIIICSIFLSSADITQSNLIGSWHTNSFDNTWNDNYQFNYTSFSRTIVEQLYPNIRMISHFTGIYVLNGHSLTLTYHYDIYKTIENHKIHIHGNTSATYDISINNNILNMDSANFIIPYKRK